MRILKMLSRNRLKDEFISILNVLGVFHVFLNPLPDFLVTFSFHNTVKESLIYKDFVIKECIQ